METTEYRIPAVALRGMVVLPEMVTHFDVSRSRSIKAVEQALSQKQNLFVVTQQDPDIDAPEQEDLFTYGTVVEIKQIVKMPHNILRVLVEGMFRARLVELETGEYLNAQVEESEPEDFGDLPLVGKEAMLRNLKEIFQTYCEGASRNSKELVRQVLDSRTLEDMITQVMVHAPFDWEKQQRLLEAQSLSACYEMLCITLNNEIEIERYRRSVQEKVKARVDKQQKEYYLREQMKVIREELGDDGPNTEAEAFREAVKKLEASDEVKERIEKEIQRFLNAGFNSAEASVSRGYIETLLDLPWNKRGEDRLDLKVAEDILEKEHYGLEKVKERILEFLAVRKMLDASESPILCLVGPPGTGKTSVARSIAEALNKKYVRICLGGVHDEAEIRGHRRTYIGAMPGRIIKSLIKAESSNPVIILDEIDKLGSDHRGDPSSAMLEVLDPEQNNSFHDNYLDVDYDLSKVMFVATANNLSTIPPALLDRMELIEVSGYITEEKVEIARRHLVPKELEANGIKKEYVKFSKAALEYIVENYTRESGVRELDKKIAKIMRKLARKMASDEVLPAQIRPEDLHDYLGAVEYTRDKYQGNDYAGVVTGLAWTAVGGEILFVESSLSKGKGSKLTLTGNLGDVMKESAMLALEYIHSHAGLFDIAEDMFENWNVHIHVPEGAIPKDGPSAGVTMVTSLVSAFTQRKVRSNLAMTGEITLRGKVLPVGGIKEKILAAKRAGIKELILCQENKKDIEEIKPDYLKGLTFHYVDDIRQVVDLALLNEKVANPLF